MFGYLAASEQDLSSDELRRYQAHYCGICQAIGKRCGQRCRVVLNHDLVFLSLLNGSLFEPPETEGHGHCLVHPVHEHQFLSTTHTDYAADLNVALAYHKALDDWNDEHSLFARASAAAIEKPYQRIRSRLPRQCVAVEQGLAAITEVEHASNSNPDEAAALFGRIMGELFVEDPQSVWAASLYALGDRLGRFIYLMDALCDLEHDLKRGSYNPLAGMDDAEQTAEDALQNLAGQATAIFEKLPLERDLHLLRSVLYVGIWSRWRTQVARREKKHEKHRDDKAVSTTHDSKDCSSQSQSLMPSMDQAPDFVSPPKENVS